MTAVVDAIQRYLSNRTNRVAGATLSASVITAVSGVVRELAVERLGRGQVALEGNFTSAFDATYDIQITGEAVNNPRQAGAIRSFGAGDGTLEDLVIADDVPAQTFDIVLREATAPVQAAALVQGIRVEAYAIGAAGNRLLLRVDEAPLVKVKRSITPYPLAAGTTEAGYWPMGGLALSATGQLNPLSERISFGQDPQVYRTYAVQRAGYVAYRFVPALVRAVPANADIFRVTGGRTLTITDAQPAARFATVSTPAAAGDFRAVASNGADKAVAVADGGGLLYSADNGATWAAAATNPLAGSAVYCVIWIASAGRFVAAGDDVAYSDDFGVNWTAAGSTGITGPVRALAAGGDQVLAVGDSGQATLSADDGETWAIQSSDALSDADFRSVVFAFDRFIAGADNGKAGVTFDGGATWDELTVPVTSSGNVAALALDVGRRRLLLGAEHDGGAGSQDGVLAYSDDLGGTWTVIDGHPHEGTAIRSLAAGFGVFAVLDAGGLLSLGRDTTFTAWTNAPLDEGRAVAAAAGGYFLVADNDELGRGKVAETATGLVRQFDFMLAAEASDYVNLAGIAPTADARPGQPGSLDFQPLTASFIQSIVQSRGSLAALTEVALAENAPTQTVQAICTDATTVGAEEWAVTTSAGTGTTTTGSKFNDAVISFKISGGGFAEGDTFTFYVIGGAAIELQGGITEPVTWTWSVNGSVSGPLPDYVQDPSWPTYGEDNPTSSLLGYKIVNGLRPPQFGDKFSFDVEGGQFKWRKNGGAWSAPADIPAAPVLLSDGLYAHFIRSDVSPSYRTDDLFSYEAVQPASVVHLQTPNDEAYEWEAGAGIIEADLGAEYLIEALAVDRHAIPEGEPVTVEGILYEYDTGSEEPIEVVAWTKVLPWSPESMVAFMEGEERYARKLRWTINQPSLIGWLYAGVPDKLSIGADAVRYRRIYSMKRGPRTAASAGRGSAGKVEYSSGFLSHADWTKLRDLVDYCKDHGEQPLIFVPNVNTPAKAWLIVFAGDAMDVEDTYEFQSTTEAVEATKVILEFQGVLP